MYQVTLLSDQELPREKLLTKGAEVLSNQELLAILLRTGTRQDSVLGLATKLLEGIDNLASLKELSVQELQHFSGIGQVKAIELKAMIELGRRISMAEIHRLDQVVSSRELGQRMMAELGDKKQEHLVALYLDTQNRIIHQKVVFIGSVRRSVADPREILHHACKIMATSLIIVHNHPSGVCQPSETDIDFTKKIKRCCDDLGVILLDHIIVGKQQYYSFQEETNLL